MLDVSPTTASRLGSQVQDPTPHSCRPRGGCNAAAQPQQC
jgi:hypothetical protein